MTETILIGIDPGTTNSPIAVNNNGTVEMVRKPGGVEYNPSVFGYDKAKNKVVGQKAEILKSLIQDLLRKYPKFNTSDAVITMIAFASRISRNGPSHCSKCHH